MKKNIVKINESTLSKIVAESVKKVLKEDYAEDALKIRVLSAIEHIVEDYGVIGVFSRIGKRVGWDKLATAIQYEFGGDNDAYVKGQEMRGPMGY